MKNLEAYEPKGHVRGEGGKQRSSSMLALARSHVSRQLSRRLPSYLTPEEAHQLIDAAETERDHLFIRLLWETGVRVSEAIGLRLADVSRDGIRVLGKGGVERLVFVQDSLVGALLFYAQEVALERNDYLFTSRKGGHITKQRADQFIKATALRANLQRNVHAHLFRHGYAINFLNRNYPYQAAWVQATHHPRREPS